MASAEQEQLSASLPAAFLLLSKRPTYSFTAESIGWAAQEKTTELLCHGQGFIVKN